MNLALGEPFILPVDSFKHNKSMGLPEVNIQHPTHMPTPSLKVIISLLGVAMTHFLLVLSTENLSPLSHGINKRFVIPCLLSQNSNGLQSPFCV